MAFVLVFFCEPHNVFTYIYTNIRANINLNVPVCNNNVVETHRMLAVHHILLFLFRAARRWKNCTPNIIFLRV